MSKLAKYFIGGGAATALLSVIANAQSLLPPQIMNLFGILGPGGSGTAAFIGDRVRFGLLLFLGGIVLLAVVYALLAAIKYIRSEGDAGKIEEAQKSIKAIFFGIAAMFIAIVGIVLVFVFFQSSPTTPSLQQVCITSPGSVGCNDCKNSTNTEAGTCAVCTKLFQAIAQGENGPLAGKGYSNTTDVPGQVFTNCGSATGKAKSCTETTVSGGNPLDCIDPAKGGNKIP